MRIILLGALLFISGYFAVHAQVTPPPQSKTISIADTKKYELEQLKIDKALSDMHAAQAEAQLSDVKILTGPSEALQKIMGDIMIKLGIDPSDLNNWGYDPNTKVFTRKREPAKDSAIPSDANKK
jgi:hypothetical protein